MDCAQSGTVYLKNLIILNAMLIFTWIIFIYFSLRIELEKVIYASNMVHVLVSNDRIALGIFFLKNLADSLDPRRTTFASIDKDSVGMEKSSVLTANEKYTYDL